MRQHKRKRYCLTIATQGERSRTGKDIIPTAKLGLIFINKRMELLMLRFQVYKRDHLGRVVRQGVVLADNKVQADTKAKMLYGKSLQYSNGELVWTQEVA